jgi:hypothetical protein
VSRDQRVDAYLETRAAPFARPVLSHIRELVHRACPDVVETIKWGVPSFEYRGPFCGVAAFKKHCIFIFWKAPLLEKQGFAEVAGDGVLRRMTSEDDLPSDARLTKIIKAAAALNDSGERVPRVKMAPKAPIKAPAYFLAALKKNRKAQSVFDAFSPSHRREYLEWITNAKTDATRDKRLAQAIEMMAAGKPRHWKYMPASKRLT